MASTVKYGIDRLRREISQADRRKPDLQRPVNKYRRGGGGRGEGGHCVFSLSSRVGHAILSPGSWWAVIFKAFDIALVKSPEKATGNNKSLKLQDELYYLMETNSSHTSPVSRISLVQKFQFIQVNFDHNCDCILLNVSTFLVQYGFLRSAPQST